MANNTLIIAAAGSGKTTYLVRRSLDSPSERVLITTYTEANEGEIKRAIIRLRGYVPANITIQTWFSFLLQHGVRPFQSAINGEIHETHIGFFLSNKRSGEKCDADGKPVVWRGRPIFWGETDFQKFYFPNSFKIYSDKTAKFVVSCNSATKGDVVGRIARVFDSVLVDEVQDLAGYDLEVLKLLFQSDCEVVLVGDPRQVTYLTHHSGKHKKYANGNIKGFVEEQLGRDTVCVVDESMLASSHRNNQAICDFSNKLYPGMPVSKPCTCEGCRGKPSMHEGIYWIAKEDLEQYLTMFQPMQLRWNVKTAVNHGHPVTNFGEAKGLSFDRVVIYPTGEIVSWLRDHGHALKDEARAKLYVAITRARQSVVFVLKPEEAGSLKDLSRYMVIDA